MGKQIIKQPNGKYCLFSTNIDNVIHYDMSEREIVDTLVQESEECIKTQVARTIEQLEAGEKPYFQFTMTYEQMQQRIEHYHGKEERENVRKLIEK